MMKKTERKMLAIFMKDRLPYIITVLLITGVYLVLMLLEWKLNNEIVHGNTILYFVLLVILIMSSWLLYDYLRQRDYYKEMEAAVQYLSSVRDSLSLYTVVTNEQKQVSELLQKLHLAYLNELGKYRRKQEMHNHFVLQWVHHMKTPVSVIDLLVQDAVDRSKHSKDAEYEGKGSFIQSIHEENDRLARGLEMMLYTARLDKFEFDVHISKVALHEIVRQAINANKRLCIQRRIFPKVEGEAWVETDGKWILFIINQLLSNAIKYSKQSDGSRQVKFTFHKEGSTDSITITDCGIGIAPQDVKRIFDPFFTGDNGRTEGESTGMGLYLSKQVCDKLGHSLSVQSELGKGTSMTIDFTLQGIHCLYD